MEMSFQEAFLSISAVALIIMTLAVALFAELTKPQEVVSLYVLPNDVDAFIEANPQYCTAAAFASKLREMGEKAAPYAQTFNRLMAEMALNKPGFAIVFRALT